ncbi:glycoside hydrolase domain-containing protein [Actinoplanes sp. NPDC049265]|uniref:glycoside hydrolase domain-containing protein n=1 Tax=Actinoplanes sp. NPDC049265 TaxID=3363902 RepID=UPI003716C385
MTAIFPAVVVAAASMLVAAPAAPTTDVTYQGRHYTVPAGWPVHNLDDEPATCVRLDQKAVYLGRPGADQDCPANAIGRTEAILIPPPRPAAAPKAAAVALSADLTNYEGKGFDPCTAPSAATMDKWKADSPYSAIGVYIGGVNRGCAQPNLTAGWVSQRAATGWKFLLLYVGLQASRNSCSNCDLITSPTAEGTAAADDAVAQATALGFGPGSLLTYDMESWTAGQNNLALPFLDAWTRRLHARGYSSGVYSSAATGITQLVDNFDRYVMPDVVDFANWNNNATVTDSHVPANRWADHQRIHQYAGDVSETHGGVTLQIDRDFFDVRLGGTGAGDSPVTTGSVVINPANGNIQVYANSGGRLVETYWSETAGWVRNELGNAISGAPVAIRNPANDNIQVYFNSGGHLAERYWKATDGQWSGQNDLGGTVTGHPVVLINPHNQNVQVHYNAGGQLAENYWDRATGTWSGQHLLGGTITGSPAVFVNPHNQNVQIHYNAGGQLAEQYWNPATGWSGQNTLGGTMSGDPAVIVNPHNQNVQVYYNAGGRLAERYWNPAAGWSGQNDLGGSITGSPAVFVNPHNQHVQVHYNSGGQLAENYWVPATGTWSGPNLLGGTMTSDPAIVVNPANQNVQVHYDAGGRLAENYWNPSGGWSGHHLIG